MKFTAARRYGMSWNTRCNVLGGLAFVIFAPLLFWGEEKYAVAALVGAFLILFAALFTEYLGHLLVCVWLVRLNRRFSRRSVELEELLAEVRVQDIMGKNFHGSEDGLNKLGFSFPRQPTFEALCRELFFDEKTLYAKRKTHMAVGVLPISIYEMRGVAPWLFARTRGDFDGLWFDALPFARDTGFVKWHLVPLSLPDDGVVPFSAQVMVYAIAIHVLVTKEWLYKGKTIHCTDTRVEGGYVTVSVGSSGFITLGDSRIAELVAEKNGRRHLSLVRDEVQEAHG